MTPSTLVRRPRGPFTFVSLTSFFLEKEDREEAPKSRRTLQHSCIAYDDAGRICGRPAHCIDMQRGGFVCDEHRPVKRELVTP